VAARRPSAEELTQTRRLGHGEGIGSKGRSRERGVAALCGLVAADGCARAALVARHRPVATRRATGAVQVMRDRRPSTGRRSPRARRAARAPCRQRGLTSASLLQQHRGVHRASAFGSGLRLARRRLKRADRAPAHARGGREPAVETFQRRQPSCAARVLTPRPPETRRPPLSGTEDSMLIPSSWSSSSAGIAP
jgi:hypothetical protein